jgi:hypothetical protein
VQPQGSYSTNGEQSVRWQHVNSVHAITGDVLLYAGLEVAHIGKVRNTAAPLVVRARSWVVCWWYGRVIHKTSGNCGSGTKLVILDADAPVSVYSSRCSSQWCSIRFSKETMHNRSRRSRTHCITFDICCFGCHQRCTYPPGT